MSLGSVESEWVDQLVLSRDWYVYVDWKHRLRKKTSSFAYFEANIEHKFNFVNYFLYFFEFEKKRNWDDDIYGMKKDVVYSNVSYYFDEIVSEKWDLY